MTWVGWGWGWGGGGGYSRMFEFVRAVAWLIKSAFFGLGNCSFFSESHDMWNENNVEKKSLYNVHTYSWYEILVNL